MELHSLYQIWFRATWRRILDSRSSVWKCWSGLSPWCNKSWVCDLVPQRDLIFFIWKGIRRKSCPKPCCKEMLWAALDPGKGQPASQSCQDRLPMACCLCLDSFTLIPRSAGSRPKAKHILAVEKTLCLPALAHLFLLPLWLRNLWVLEN